MCVCESVSAKRDGDSEIDWAKCNVYTSTRRKERKCLYSESTILNITWLFLLLCSAKYTQPFGFSCICTPITLKLKAMWNEQSSWIVKDTKSSAFTRNIRTKITSRLNSIASKVISDFVFFSFCSLFFFSKRTVKSLNRLGVQWAKLKKKNCIARTTCSSWSTCFQCIFSFCRCIEKKVGVTDTHSHTHKNANVSEIDGNRDEMRWSELWWI